jgi:serine/threonine protein kinase
VTAPKPIGQLRAVELRQPELQFVDGEWTYVTSGKRIGHGGMGAAYLVTRWREGEPGQVVVAKTFREEFLLTLRDDEVARRHFDHYELLLDELKTIEHAHLLPVLQAKAIADNFLLVTPLAGGSLMTVLAGNKISPRERVWMLCDALKGLAALHARGIIHRDFTLQNILTMGDRAVLFDFDISVAPRLLPDGQRSYNAYYEGRILGAPEFSIAPELLDDVLGEQELSPAIDVYAAGTALHALFSNDSIYGDVPDLATLLTRIAMGVVHKRESRISFSPEVPRVLHPIIETCLERDPERRYASAQQLLASLEVALERLSEEEREGPLRKTLGYGVTQVTPSPEELFAEAADPGLSLDDFRSMERVADRYGYVLQQSLGKVKGHAIFLVAPDPELVAKGQFPDDNPYRKILTAIDLRGRDRAYVETWLGKIAPLLRRLRQGFLTSLYKVVHDEESQQLLLFSEYIDDPRFGTDLAEHELNLEEVFGLGLIVALSIARLHGQGLAHNNVEPRSLLFKGFRDSGRVQTLFVGLVDPSFAPEARANDVRQLASMLAALIRPARVDVLRAELRAIVERSQADLADIAATTPGSIESAPTIHIIVHLCARALGALDGNFELVRKHGGDVAAFADLMIRHSLYNKLYTRRAPEPPRD